MSKWLYLFIISSIFCQTGFTKIPNAILEYLKNNEDHIHSDVNLKFNTQERDIIAQRIAEKLITRYKNLQENSETTEKEITSELMHYIKNKIINRDIPKTEEKTKKDAHATNKGKEIAEKIFKTYPGTFDGKILRINYNGAVIPLKVKASERAIAITLPGVRLPLPHAFDRYKECLKLNIMNSLSSAHITWLGSLETVCPLPVEKEQGAYLLKLAEDITRALEIPYSKLSDGSQVLCVKDLEQTDLRLLRVWEKKKSWYESKDYTPIASKIGQLLEKEREQLNALTIGDFQTALHKKINAETKPFIEKLQEFRKSAPQKDSPYFADFMAWLWPHDCAAYNKVFELFKLYNKYLDEGILINQEIWLQKKL